MCGTLQVLQARHFRRSKGEGSTEGHTSGVGEEALVDIVGGRAVSSEYAHGVPREDEDPSFTQQLKRHTRPTSTIILHWQLRVLSTVAFPFVGMICLLPFHCDFDTMENLSIVVGNSGLPACMSSLFPAPEPPDDVLVGSPFLVVAPSRAPYHLPPLHSVQWCLEFFPGSGRLPGLGPGHDIGLLHIMAVCACPHFCCTSSVLRSTC